MNVGSLLFEGAPCHDAAAMHRYLPRRLLAVAWLLAWIAGPVVSLALLVHVTSDHHHHHRRALDLAMATTHGHSHPVAAADHEHVAVRESAPRMAPATVVAAPHQAALANDVSRTVRVELSDPSPPTGSPPLFYRYCALLL